MVCGCDSQAQGVAPGASAQSRCGPWGAGTAQKDVCTKPQSCTPNLDWSPAYSHTQRRNIWQIIFTVPDEFRCLFLNLA